MVLLRPMASLGVRGCLCLPGRQWAISACCSGEPIKLYHDLQELLIYHPAGKACREKCDGWKKKDSSQKDSRLKILQARAIDHPGAAARRQPRQGAGRPEFSLSRDRADL